MNLKAIGDVLEALSGPFEVIYANGGFTRMKFWVEMAAAIFGRKVVTSENEGGPALGAAMVGMRALEIDN